MHSVSERFETAMRNRQELYGLDIETLPVPDGDREHWPEGVDMRPGSPVHDRLVQLVNEYTRSARDNQSGVVEEWRALDWLYEGYMPADLWDQGVQDRDPRKPVAVTIGSAFAARNIFRAFMGKVQQGRHGIYRYRGQGGRKRQARAAVAERIMERQSHWFRHRRQLDIMNGNAFTYGRAPVAINWRKRMGMVSRTETVTPLLAMQLAMRGLDVPIGAEIKMPPEPGVVAEGTELEALDVYQCLWDPDVAPDKLQDAAFFGYQYRTNARLLRQRGLDDEEFLFNTQAVDVLAHENGFKSRYWNEESGRGVRMGQAGGHEPSRPRDRHDVHVTRLFVRLVPADLGLGDSTDVAWWLISVAGDRVVIECRELNHWHSRLPVAEAAPNADLSVWPVSHQLAVSKLHMLKNWLVKSRADAVMTILVGRIFVNQRFVNMEDMKRPLMGKLVRVNHSEYDTRGVRDFVHQLDTPDPTAAHMSTLLEIDQIDGNVSGIGDLTMGIMGNMPERPGVAGIQAAQAGMFSRMEHDASVIDEQAIQEIAHQCLHNTIQWQDQDIRLSVLGRYPELVRREFGLAEDEDEFMASAFDLDPDFEVVPYRASQQGRDPAQMAELMKTLLSVEGVGQMIAQETNIKNLWWATWRELGAQVEDEWEQEFEMNVMDDEQLQREVQAGNLVGVGDMA